MEEKLCVSERLQFSRGSHNEEIVPITLNNSVAFNTCGSSVVSGIANYSASLEPCSREVHSNRKTIFRSVDAVNVNVDLISSCHF